MKLLYALYFLLSMLTISAQETILKSFDFENVMIDKDGKSNIINPVYGYLTQNYTALSDKESLGSNGVGDCGFRQAFSSGICYMQRHCGDAALATGEVLEIANPDRASVILWVESVNKMYGDYDQNLWNFDQSEYVPVGGIPGAYFQIIREKDLTKILVMSGC